MSAQIIRFPVVNKRTNESPKLSELMRTAVPVKERKDHPVLKAMAFEVKA